MKCGKCQSEWNSPKGSLLTNCPFCKSPLLQELGTQSDEKAIMKSIVDQYGYEVLLNQQILSSLISDYIHDKKMKTLLVNAIKANVTIKVYALISKDELERESGVKSTAVDFQDEYCITGESAFMAVYIFAYACGICVQYEEPLAATRNDNTSKIITAERTVDTAAEPEHVIESRIHTANLEPKPLTKSDAAQLTGENIIIPYGYTAIDSSAFAKRSEITSVQIPDGVTIIRCIAFYQCTSLTSVMIPASVTCIERGAFEGCGKLKIITIPNSVSYIGSGAFSGTAWYNSQPDGMVYAGKVAYMYKGTMPAATNCILKNDTISIAEHAFLNCTGLSGISMPDCLTKIGQYAFMGCTGLKSVTIPKDIREINHLTFENCVGLTNIDIPGSVRIIGGEAFKGCTGLTKINISKGVEAIWGSAYKNCTGLQSVTIPDSVTYIEDSAFLGTAWYNSHPDGVVYAGKVAYKYKGEMPAGTNIELKSDTISIGGHAFENCAGLASISIPDCLTLIHSSAFNGCMGLKSVKIPSGVTVIGSHAFSNCSSLTSVTIPGSVTDIDWGAFEKCSGLKGVTILKGVKQIGIRAFADCSGITEVVLPNGITYIGEMAFSGCKNLVNINIPDSVTCIEHFAFAPCENLKKIAIPNSVKIMGYSSLNSISSFAKKDKTVFNPDVKVICSKNSYAYQYCKEMKIKVKTEKDILFHIP